MQFNAQAAKAAGYTDEEVADFLESHAAAREAGYAPEEIDKFLTERTPPPLERNPEVEQEIQTYLGGPKPSARGLQAIGERYGITFPNAGDVASRTNRYGAETPTFDYKGTPQEVPHSVESPERGFEIGNTIRSLAKGASFNFNDEIEAMARAPFTDLTYRQEKDRINADYDQWAADNPKTALGGELAGGVGTLFIPGLGATNAVARGAQGVGALRNTANLAAMGAKYGAGYGAVAGAGAADEMGDIPLEVARGAGEGAVGGALLGPGFHYFGKGAGALYRKARGIPSGALSKAEEGAERQLLESATRDGSISDVEAAARLRTRYGVPFSMGDLSPELQKLQIKVARSPSEGQTGMLEDITQNLVGSPERIKGKVHEAFPDVNDYFDTAEQITGRLKGIYATQGETAINAASQVRDPAIMKLIHNPVMSRYFLKARDLADRKAAAAEAAGLDPTPFKMKMEFEPVIDAQGALVGLTPSGRTIPDGRALDYLSRALKDDADAGFSGDSSAGKSIGAAANDIRKALLARMDEAVPGYREYREAYAGEKAVEDALQLGRDKFTTMRPQEIEVKFKRKTEDGGFSQAERKAFSTGVVQHLLQPIENPAQLRNFAENIVNSDATRQKLKLLLPKAQYEVFEAALKLESEAFKGGSKAVSGNPEMARITQEIEQTMAEEGATPGALIKSLGMVPNFSSPGSHIRAVAHFVGMGMKLPWVKRRDEMFTSMAKALREKDAGKIVDLLNSAEAHEAGRIAQAERAQRKAALTGAATGKTLEQATSTSTPNAPAVEVAGDYSEPESPPPTSGGTSLDDLQIGDVPVLFKADGSFATPDGESLTREEAKTIFTASGRRPELFEGIAGSAAKSDPVPD